MWAIMTSLNGPLIHWTFTIS